jgi:hypothetical protein
MTRSRTTQPDNSKAALKWSLKWGRELSFLQERADAGLHTPALEQEPRLEPDLQKIMDAYYVLNRTRPISMGKRPANLLMADIKTVWETSGWQRLEMPFDEFLHWMLVLEEELGSHYPADGDG